MNRQTISAKSLAALTAQGDIAANLAELREQRHLIKIKLPLIGETWLTTTHASTSAMLKDSERFTMRSKRSGLVAGIRWWMPQSLRLLAKNMLTSDDPDHKRLRKLVDQAFQRRAVQEMRGDVTKVADDLLDQIEANRGDSSADVDLVEAYVRQLPMEVIAELLGIPNEYRDKFRSLARTMGGISSIWGFIRLIPALSKMRMLMVSVIDDFRNASEQPAGLISELLAVQAESRGQGAESLSDDELVAMLFLLLMAGHETTTHMISTSVHALETNEDQKRVFLNGQNAELAVEELLRFNAPVQYSKPRHVRTGGEFFDTDIKEGDLIMAGLALSNRDPEIFEDPDLLDLTRKPNPHLEFGTGVHFCLGFQLARLEIDIGLRALYSRFPHLRLSGEPKWRTAFGWRALKELPVNLG